MAADKPRTFSGANSPVMQGHRPPTRKPPRPPQPSDTAAPGSHDAPQESALATQRPAAKKKTAKRGGAQESPSKRGAAKKTAKKTAKKKATSQRGGLHGTAAKRTAAKDTVTKRGVGKKKSSQRDTAEQKAAKGTRAKEKTVKLGRTKEPAQQPPPPARRKSRVRDKDAKATTQAPKRARRPKSAAEGTDIAPLRRATARGAQTTQVPCLSCGLCCTYIAVDIDAPSTVRRATQILWYLYHGQVSVYWDHEDEWLLQFETRCRHLQPDRKCAIYEQRPHICRDFDAKSCEVNAADEGTSFHSAEEFLTFLKERRRAVYRKLQEGGYLPAAETLSGPPADRSRLEPFEKRFRRLRVLGGHPSP